MNCFPDSPLLNVLVAMAVDAARTGNMFPRYFGKPFLERRRQTARRLGNNFEATRRGVKGFVVGRKPSRSKPSTKRIARAMLSRMSSSASRSISESIDRVGGRVRSKAGLQGFPVDHVNGTLKQACDVILQAGIIEHRGDNAGSRSTRMSMSLSGRCSSRATEPKRAACMTPCARNRPRAHLMSL